MMELEPIIPPHNQGVPQDLDLIQALWEQDIDLGVGKEVFDPNLRRELERERELELQKEQQKQKEQELLQKKLEEQRRHAQQRWLHDNFTQDGETGEWVPMGGSRIPPPPSEMGTGNSGPEQFISTFDTMMGDGLPQENNYPPLPQAQPQYQGPQPIHPQSSQVLYNNTMGQYNQQMNPASMGYRPTPQPHQPQCNMGQAFHQAQQQYNNTANYTHQQHNFTHVQNVSQNSHSHHQQHQQQQQQQNYPRQSSLEATWQDLVNILDLPPTNQSRVAGPDHSMMNNTVPNRSMPPMQNTSSMLIQNASMPTPAPMQGNVTFNNTVMGQCHRSPPHSSGMMSPCGENFNSSMPSGSGLGNMSWDACGDFIFPNITTDFNDDPTDPIDDVDELLPDLITEDELEDINFSEMGLTDGMTPTPAGGNKGSDDASSDSAVSLGSQSMGSPEENDFSDSAMSPFDGLEGATGGHSGPKFSKTSKYDPDDFKFSNSCSYSSGENSNGSNFSSSSNDTGGGGHFSHGGGHGCFSPGSNGHINHNHTYPLKPGADPRDIKRHPYINKEGKHKGPQSKDNKRIEELKIPFTVDHIVNSPVEEFNEMLTRHKFTDQQLQLIRDIRRRGKNKVAAQNCRKRKIVVIEHLEDEMVTMEKMRDKLLHERHMMEKQTREMKEKLGLLYSEIFHSLRDENGQPYDPARYSLQQSSDGDVFLVPRNYTSEEELNKKRKEERK